MPPTPGIGEPQPKYLISRSHFGYIGTRFPLPVRRAPVLSIRLTFPFRAEVARQRPAGNAQPLSWAAGSSLLQQSIRPGTRSGPGCQTPPRRTAPFSFRIFCRHVPSALISTMELLTGSNSSKIASNASLLLW